MEKEVNQNFWEYLPTSRMSVMVWIWPAFFYFLLCGSSAYSWSVKIGPISMGHNRHRGLQADILSGDIKKDKERQRRELAERDLREKKKEIRNEIYHLNSVNVNRQKLIDEMKDSVALLEEQDSQRVRLASDLDVTRLEVGKVVVSAEKLSEVIRELNKIKKMGEIDVRLPKSIDVLVFNALEVLDSMENNEASADLEEALLSIRRFVMEHSNLESDIFEMLLNSSNRPETTSMEVVVQYFIDSSINAQIESNNLKAAIRSRKGKIESLENHINHTKAKILILEEAL